MTLNHLTAAAAGKQLSHLPQTHHVFAMTGRFQAYTLVWVLKDGSRHHLSTHEQVRHALGDDVWGVSGDHALA